MWLGHHFQGQKDKGQGHQAALLTAALTRQAAAAVSVGTYWPLRSSHAVGSAARGAWEPTEGGQGRGHTVAAARPPTACFALGLGLKNSVLFTSLVLGNISTEAVSRLVMNFADKGCNVGMRRIMWPRDRGSSQTTFVEWEFLIHYGAMLTIKGGWFVLQHPYCKTIFGRQFSATSKSVLNGGFRQKGPKYYFIIF